jgi:dolichyl-phosphate beta-glucosyltransferase
MSYNILLVIPSYNDSFRLGSFMPELCETIYNFDLKIRIQVVDDGSIAREVSQTRKVVEACQKKFSGISPLLCLGRNCGKGGAVYAGWEQARDEEWLAFVDADGAIPANEVVRFCQHIFAQKQIDGLLASRVLMLGHNIDRTTKRHIVGRVYATLAKILVGVPVYDSQCGFKFFKRSCFEQVRVDLETLRFGFDLELLAGFHSKGFRLLEMPIRQWRDVPGAKVRLVRDSLEMFVSLWKLRNRMRIKKTWMSSNKNN